MKDFVRIVYNNISLLTSKVFNMFNRRDASLWVFGEWMGLRCCDNSMYFANYIVNNHPEITAVWISKAGIDLSFLDSKVHCCEMDSKEARDYLKKAGAVFITHGLEDIIGNSKCEYSGALVVNLWHGSPWKKIQFDMPYSLPDLLYQKMRRGWYEGKTIVSNSEEMTRILPHAFSVRKENIIESGSPRNIVFHRQEAVERARRQLLIHLNSSGVKVNDSSKIITYMPTFRDKDQHVFSFYELQGNSRFIQMLERYNAVLVQKAHFVSVQRNSASDNISGRIVSLDNYQSQELLASTDILITDYSSCFFDYLILDRPIIHYLYDYDYYANQDRGLYYKKEEVVCGDVASDLEELLNCIEKNLENPAYNHELRRKRAKKFISFETPASLQNLYNEIIKRLK